MTNWSKQFWVNLENALLLDAQGIGFDQAWNHEGMDHTIYNKVWPCYHNYGRRIDPKSIKDAKVFRVHQDSIDIYERLNQ